MLYNDFFQWNYNDFFLVLPNAAHVGHALDPLPRTVPPCMAVVRNLPKVESNSKTLSHATRQQKRRGPQDCRTRRAVLLPISQREQNRKSDRLHWGWRNENKPNQTESDKRNENKPSRDASFLGAMPHITNTNNKKRPPPPHQSADKPTCDALLRRQHSACSARPLTHAKAAATALFFLCTKNMLRHVSIRTNLPPPPVVFTSSNRKLITSP